MTFQKLRVMQSKFFSFGTLLLVVVLIVGCAVAPKPSIDVFIEAVEGQVNSKIHPETGAITMIQNGVAVTIEPIDEVEIFSLTEDPHINPYVVVDRSGNVEQMYTIFDITVLNIDASRVLVEDSSTLIDKNGAQYANLPYAFFQDLYDNFDSSEFSTNPTPRYPHYYPYYPRYRTYLDVASLEEGHAIVADTLLESGKLFKGAKKRGLLIFDRLDHVTTDLRISVSDVRIVDSDGKEKKLKFHFDFRQVVVEN